MAQDYAKSFYQSKMWQRCRDSFMSSKYYVCERCGSVATITHHKQYITPENINNPNITLDWNNLESLCQDCHNKEHMGSQATASGLSFDRNGNLIHTPH